MASEKDKAHFRAIAEAMERENREALRREALRPPGEKIEEGLRLSRHVLQPHEGAGVRLGPEPVALIALWMRLGRSGRRR